MKQKIAISLFAVFIFITILLSGCTNNSLITRNIDNNSIKSDMARSAPTGTNPRSPEEKPSPYQQSGTVTEVPWEDDARFKTIREKTGAAVRMAAFCTVLRDPLTGEEANVHLAARMLAGTVVQPGKVFSQNNSVGPYSSARGFQKGPVYIGSQLSTTVGGGVCKIASTLYNVSVLCDLPVVERHAHGMPVPYVPYGQDATVSYGTKDFKFLNNLDCPILIWAEGVDNRLYMAFYSKKAAPRVEWHHQILQSYTAPKYYRQNTSLPEGARKVILEGMDGALVKSWVSIFGTDGSKKEKQLGKSYYMPMPHIIETHGQPRSAAQ